MNRIFSETRVRITPSQLETAYLRLIGPRQRSLDAKAKGRARIRLYIRLFSKGAYTLIHTVGRVSIGTQITSTSLSYRASDVASTLHSTDKRASTKDLEAEGSMGLRLNCTIF